MFRAERPRPPASATPVSAPTWHREGAERPTIVSSGVLAAVLTLVTLWPFTAVIAPGAWSFAVVVVTITVALVGMLLRRLLRARASALRGVVTLLAQLAAAIGVLTLLVAGDTALFGLIPTPTTLSVFGGLAARAWEEIVFGSAPLPASPALAAVLGAGFAVVALLLDLLVNLRAAVLAAVLAGSIGAIPMIVTLGDANVVWFVLFAVTVLVLFRFTARRDPLAPRHDALTVAVGVGAAAVAATLVVAPLLPVTPTVPGTGAGVAVDASLRLGDDLRQPNPVEVVTVAAKGDAAPYLRLTTLSRFDGRVWQPDRGDLQSQGDGFGPPDWGEDVPADEVNTSVRVLNMSSSWLPVPYPATEVRGLTASWRVAPENRTLFSRSSDAAGKDYTVTSVRLSPTLEQIRGLAAAPPLADADEEPVELPAIIGRLAAEVTQDEGTDYDRLVALQTWFRSQFSYSLETPVEEGFDGTGAEAVAQFLEVRSGYCVHFAGAFALMAESLDMRTRIVVGYLPGSRTDERRGDETIFSVTSDQLHSWPEVFFPGVGWVPFEPTASLGVPTAFQEAATQGPGAGTPSSPAPTASPRAEETSGPERESADAGDDPRASGQQRRLDPMPVVYTVAGVLAVLLLPALVRAAERRGRLARARRGDAAAAWAELRDTIIDLRLPVSDADSPRARAAGLVKDRAVEPADLRRLTDAVEQSNYARDAGGGTDLREPLTAVLAALRRSVDGPTRVRATLLPRSLYAPRAAEPGVTA